MSLVVGLEELSRAITTIESGGVIIYPTETVYGLGADALNSRSKSVKDSKILVLGAAYKKDIDDLRESPALELIELLKERGAVVSYNDPYVPVIPKVRKHNLNLKSVDLTPQVLAEADCVLVATAHSDYDWQMICDSAQLIVDTRNATHGISTEPGKVWKA